MKIQLDENLPTELVQTLTSLKRDVHTVQVENLTGKNDGVIFNMALAAGRLLITQDLDFSDIRRFKPGIDPGIVVVRLRDPNRRKLIDRMAQTLQNPDLEAWARCFVVIGDIRLRIIRP